MTETRAACHSVSLFVLCFHAYITCTSTHRLLMHMEQQLDSLLLACCRRRGLVAVGSAEQVAWRAQRSCWKVLALIIRGARSVKELLHCCNSVSWEFAGCSKRRAGGSIVHWRLVGCKKLRHNVQRKVMRVSGLWPLHTIPTLATTPHL
jgi:hypothetical protein